MALAAAPDSNPATDTLPRGLPYEGHLAVDGVPLNGTVAVTFALFSLPVAGMMLFEETQREVSFVNGRFSVLLGVGDARIPSIVFGRPSGGFYGRRSTGRRGRLQPGGRDDSGHAHDEREPDRERDGDRAAFRVLAHPAHGKWDSERDRISPDRFSLRSVWSSPTSSRASRYGSRLNEGGLFPHDGVCSWHYGVSDLCRRKWQLDARCCRR